MSTKHTTTIFLQNGGNMGALIRNHDWITTPLGEPHTWPQTLQTMVGVLLENPFSMYIAWGKDYTQIYNDAFTPILGTIKHPKTLGISARETFAEVWHIIEPLYDDAMQGKAVALQDFMLPLNRNGYTENCYFDLSFSPIRLETGDVGGVLATVKEITHKKKADNELKDSKKELEFVIEASRLGTYDYNPLTNKFSGNARLKQWFGLPPEEQIALSDAINAVSENDKERVFNAITKVLEYSSGGNYDVEYSVINKITKKETIVHAKGKAWFNEQNIAYRLNGTLEDVTNKVLARKKMEESERSFRLMILQAPVAISIFRGSDYKIEIANKNALELWGRTEEEVLNTSLFESMPELASQGIKELLDAVAKTGIPYSTAERPIQFLRNDILETVHINFSYEPLYDAEGKINGIMGIGYDVTLQVNARKKIEESEENIRALIENIPFPIAVYVGEEMKISLANQSIIDIWGKNSDVIGKLYPEILPEFGNETVLSQIKKVLRTGIPFHAKNYKVDIIKEDKQHSLYFNYSFTPLLDNSGNVYAVINTAAEVTELNEAKHKVEENEKRFREAVTQAPLGIVILRGKDNIAEIANSNYLEIVDKTEKQFVGIPLFKSLPEVRETITPIIADIYKTGNAFYGYEFPIYLNRYGKTEISYFNFVYHPLKEENIITGIMVVATEVTATIKAKNIIKENQEKLNLIIESSELGVFDVNLKTQAINASKRCYDILGFTAQENLDHKTLVTNHHPDDLQIREKAFQKAFLTGSLHYQSRILWKDNSLHWIDAKGKVYYDKDNKPERLLGTVREITEERNFQQELLDREEKFRLLADSMPQHIWTSDPEGKLNYFNQSVYDFSGFAKDHIDNIGWLEIVHPDDREENIKQWNHSINTGEDFLIEHRFRKHNGEYRWQLSRAIPQKDKDGVIKMWVGSSTDIEEQKVFTTKLENMVLMRTNELQEKNKDLEKMNKELQSFVYISSHDLQEPLRKIQTFASRIIETEYDTLTETAKKHFTRMQKSAFRMQNLIQDLIAYSRTNVQDINFETVDLNDIIIDTEETLSEELEQHNVTMELNNICDVKIISVQFKQVILNLISNSIKFSKPDQPIIIKIDCGVVEGHKTGIDSLTTNKEYTHIRISDNGIGFEQQYSERIFEVFQRLHSREAYIGTGIGLAIVKRIIENHEGAIVASSNLNEGATFDIYIPA